MPKLGSVFLGVVGGFNRSGGTTMELGGTAPGGQFFVCSSSVRKTGLSERGGLIRLFGFFISLILLLFGRAFFHLEEVIS